MYLAKYDKPGNPLTCSYYEIIDYIPHAILYIPGPNATAGGLCLLVPL